MFENVAIWTLTELTRRLSQDNNLMRMSLASYLHQLLYDIFAILQNDDNHYLLDIDDDDRLNLQETLRQNVAILLGILCEHLPEELGSLMDREIFMSWCQSLILITSINEELEAFSGLVKILHHQPQLQAFIHENSAHLCVFLEACLVWEERPPSGIINYPIIL